MPLYARPCITESAIGEVLSAAKRRRIGIPAPSFGVVVWEMVTGKLPYEGMDAVAVARCVAIDGLRLPPPPVDKLACPQELVRLIAACFADMSERPMFHEILHSLDVCADTATRMLAVRAAGAEAG